MPRPKLDSKGRIVIPQEERIVWQLKTGDAVTARVESDTGASTSVQDTIDDRGRITIPKPEREELEASAGDRVKPRVVDVQDGDYECDDCGGSFNIGKVLITSGGDRIVCAECSTPSDRIIQ